MLLIVSHKHKYPVALALPWLQLRVHPFLPSFRTSFFSLSSFAASLRMAQMGAFVVAAEKGHYSVEQQNIKRGVILEKHIV